MLAVLLTIYLLGIFALSLFASRRVHNEEDYIVAGRRLPLWLAWGTLLATWFGAATMTGAAGAARNEGLRGTILDPFASGLALIVAGLFFAKPLWEMKLLTIADFYGRRFGDRAEVAASIILIPGYFGWIAAQFVALAELQETFFGIEHANGILLAAGLITLYTLVGGMWSVTLTDTLQMGVILVTLVILAGVTFAHLGGGAMTDGVTRLFKATPADRLSILPEAGTAAAIAWGATWASGVFGNIPGQDLTQRIFASNSASTAKHACILAGVMYIGFGLLPVGIGLASNILAPDAEGNILGILAHEYLTPWSAAVFVVALVSVIVSTATSAVLAPASILAHNLVGRFEHWQSRRLLVDRSSVLFIATASVIVSFTNKSILELLELSLSIVVVTLFVPLVVGLWGRNCSEPAALAAMISGLIVWIARELMEGLLLPMSQAAQDAGMQYADFVRESTSGDVWATLLYVFALFPAAISGTAVSAAAYWIASRLDQSATTEPPNH